MMRILLIAVFLFAGLSCKKEKAEEFNGTIEDFTGRLDGCTDLIQLDNGKRLEPALNSSGVTLIAGKRIAITYKIKPAYSVCMAGETIEILTLRYL